MGLILSERDKLLILLVAAILILLTLVVTWCLVKPGCLLNQWLVKQQVVKKEPSFSLVYPSFINPESQHFHLSIVPVYGSQTDGSKSLASSPVKRQSEQGNQFENLTQLAEKTRMRYSSLKPDNIKVLPLFPKVKAKLCYELVGESNICLHLTIVEVYDLKPKEYMTEPSCYVTVILVGYKAQRKSIINKVTQSEIFRTETVKRSLNPVFVKSQMVSETLPKCLMKEGCLKLRVMDEERNANDICLGEVSVPLKKILPLEKREVSPESSTSETSPENGSVPTILVNTDKVSAELSTYTLFPIKEVKGEIFVGFCYLPTSKRINITVVKANLRCSLPQSNSNSSMHQAFYTGILMFNNGKLVKKKKTSLSVKLVWGENETVSFDLNEEPFPQLSFMVVLSCKMQNSTTPSSPESPQSPESSSVAEPSRHNSTYSHFSRKDRHIGHFVLDKDIWLEEIVKRPRKQVLKWYKLY